MSVLDVLTETELRSHFDVLTLHRGREYAAAGRVSEPRITAVDEEFVTASASVAGSRMVPYRTQLTAGSEATGLWLTTSCSCPVRTMCKHGAALAFTLIRQVEEAPRPRAWAQDLQQLLENLAEENQPDDDLTPLALEVAVEAGRPGGPGVPGSAAGSALSGRTRPGQQPTPRIRPLRLSKRGRWVKTGADWADLVRSLPGKDFPRSQLEPLRELGQALQQQRAYWYAGAHAPLDDFGPHVVELLAQAVAGGVSILPGPGINAVRMLAEPLALTAHARRNELGETELRFGFELDPPGDPGEDIGDDVVDTGGDGGNDPDRPLASGPTVLPIGRPAHSVAILDHGTLRIARLDQPLPRAAQRLVVAETPLRVPESDTPELAALLGPLARLLPVHSPDESVAVPEPPAAELHLTVTWHDATRATLAWEWRYASRRYPLDSTTDLGVVRDVVTEGEIVSRVPAGLLKLTELTGGEALAFAIHDVPALKDVPGVAVTEQERPEFRESEQAPQIGFELAEPPEDHTDWLDLEVVITVDGEPIPLPDVLAALTKGEDFLVLPSGLYVPTDIAEFDRLREVVAAAGQLHERRGDRIGVGKQDFGVLAELAELGVVADEAATWVDRARALRDVTALPHPEPTGVVTRLRSYQLEGFWWLTFLRRHGLGGILADDMGLGKTLQVLATIAHAAAEGATAPFLVVAPTSVVPAWVSEATQHTPGLKIATVTRRSDDVAALAGDADVVVATYSLLRLEQDQFAGRPWAGLVLDEAQQVKNHQSKTYAAARRVEADFRLAVTGTPFENRLMELWALLSIVAPGLYPQPRRFRELVVTPVEKRGDQGALRPFRRRLRPFLLRRTKDLVAADLPPKQEQVLGVALSSRHRKIYDAHLAKERQRILHLLDEPGGFDGNQVAILASLTRLRQLALDPALVDPEHEGVGSAKLDLLVEQLAEISAEGHRALVFSQFTSYLGRVRERLEEAGLATAYLDGSTRDRGAVLERFRAGEAAAFLISLKAGGVGLTLTEADYVYVLDPWWNPAAEAQAVDRAHRIGQTRHVMVYRLVSTDTIEEKVMELKGRKAELFARVVDGDGAASTAIDAADIRALFEE